jgi:hypothetical protein
LFSILIWQHGQKKVNWIYWMGIYVIIVMEQWYRLVVRLIDYVWKFSSSKWTPKKKFGRKNCRFFFCCSNDFPYCLVFGLRCFIYLCISFSALIFFLILKYQASCPISFNSLPQNHLWLIFNQHFNITTPTIFNQNNFPRWDLDYNPDVFVICISSLYFFPNFELKLETNFFSPFYPWDKTIFFLDMSFLGIIFISSLVSIIYGIVAPFLSKLIF